MRTVALGLESSQFSIGQSGDDLDQAVALAKDLGLGFEIWEFAVPPALNDEQEYSRLVDRYAAILPHLQEYKSMHGPFMEMTPHSRDSAIVGVVSRRVDRAMETADEIGCDAVVFHTGMSSHMQIPRYIDSVLSRQVDFWSGVLSRHGRTSVLLENMWEHDPAILGKIVERVGDSRLGVCVDVGHAHIHSSSGPAEWISDLAPHVRHMHWSDNDGVVDGHLPVGSGSIDWDEVVHSANSLEQRVQVVLEVKSLDAARASMEFLRNTYSVQFREDTQSAT